MFVTSQKNLFMIVCFASVLQISVLGAFVVFLYFFMFVNICDDFLPFVISFFCRFADVKSVTWGVVRGPGNLQRTCYTRSLGPLL